MLSLFAALLLAASSLSQVAHFLLVPHAFCAAHGELLELPASPTASITDTHASPSEGASVSPVEAEDSHDHCQLLARAQREQLVPAVASVELSACAPERLNAVPLERESTAPALDCLVNAPKTSPPVANAG